MTYKIDKTFPAKLGGITDTRSLPFDVNAAAYEGRLKRVFKKLFGSKVVENDYWKTLIKMISDPGETFGLVEIDGFLSDMAGKDDIALVFNMGIPRLRGRKVYYLDRIYVRIPMNGDLKFYNSGIEDNDVYWHRDYKVPAWHPHIQNAVPCLGSYGTELARWKSEANPIMYLRTLHMFLNTWNRQSPFFDINNTKIDCQSDKKSFKRSKIFNSMFNHGLASPVKDENFILDNVDKINTGSVQNDIYIIAIILEKLNYVREEIGSEIVNKMDHDQWLYLRNIHEEAVRRRGNSSSLRSFSLINARTEVRIMIPEYNNETTSVRRKSIKTHKVTSTMEYRVKSNILRGLEYLMENIYNYLNKGAIYNIIYNESDYAINLYCNYYVPALVREQKHFDKMTKTGKYPTRIHRESSESNIVDRSLTKDKFDLIRRTNLRRQRTNRMMIKHYGDMFTKDFVYETICNKIKDAFYYQIDEEMHDWQTYPNLLDRGAFWINANIYHADEDYDMHVEILEGLYPNNLTELIKLYEDIKRSVIQEESKHLISEYSKVIRSLEKYDKTNHTEEDTQQVHLSFE